MLSDFVDEWPLMKDFPFSLPGDLEARFDPERKILAIWSPSKRKHVDYKLKKHDLDNYNKVVGPMVSNIFEGNPPMSSRLQGMNF